MLFALLLVNALAFFLMYIDKSNAKSGCWRIPERKLFPCGTVDDLPASVRELYENVWSEADGWPEYVVTMDGKPCMAFSILVDKGYIRELTDSCTAGKDRIDTAASEVCKATAQSLQEKLPCGQVFYGENTDPCGSRHSRIILVHWREGHQQYRSKERACPEH